MSEDTIMPQKPLSRSSRLMASVHETAEGLILAW